LADVDLFQGGEEDWLVGSPNEKPDESISNWLRQDISYLDCSEHET
jgi:hypothetical protein